MPSMAPSNGAHVPVHIHFSGQLCQQAPSLNLARVQDLIHVLKLSVLDGVLLKKKLSVLDGVLLKKVVGFRRCVVKKSCRF